MGKLLVVDGDKMFREFVCSILSALGHDSVQAKDGLEAILIYRAMHDQISIVILDVSMSRMSGITASKAIRKVNPLAKIILTIGYTDKIPNEAQTDAFLPKPFSIEDLSDVIKKVMQGDKPTPWVVNES